MAPTNHAARPAIPIKPDDVKALCLQCTRLVEAAAYSEVIGDTEMWRMGMQEELKRLQAEMNALRDGMKTRLKQQQEK